MTAKNAAEKLRREADRYTALAKDLALNYLTNPNAPDAAKEWQQAQDQLFRADTYKAAANLIEQPNS